jgi:hypothetical protein
MDIGLTENPTNPVAPLHPRQISHKRYDFGVTPRHLDGWSDRV